MGPTLTLYVGEARRYIKEQVKGGAGENPESRRLVGGGGGKEFIPGTDKQPTGMGESENSSRKDLQIGKTVHSVHSKPKMTLQSVQYLKRSKSLRGGG